MVVNLLYNIFDFCLANALIQTFLFNDLFEFLGSDHSCTVQVYGLELSPQVFYFIFCCHFNKKVHHSLLECRLALKIAKVSDHIVTDLNLGGGLSPSRAKSLEPIMFDRLTCHQSLFRVTYQQLSDKVFALF